MSIIISIDGNIGSGKSTIIQNLKNQFINEDHIIFLEEPVSEWIKIRDNEKNIIEKFYEDPNKYSFAFQMMALISRFKILNDTIAKYPNSIIITERSLYTDKYIFAKMLYDSNKINIFEYQIYNLWFDEFKKKIPQHKFIYLQTNPNTCIDRIRVRARDGEDKIDIDYLKSCNEYHEKMFQQVNYDLKLNLDHANINTTDYILILNEIRSYILLQHTNTLNINIILLILVLSLLLLLLYNDFLNILH